MNDVISKIKELEFEKILWLIFIFTIVLSLFIHLYFVYRNYKNYQNDKEKSKNINLDLIRLAGSILIVVGVTFILYYEVKEEIPFGIPTA